MIVIDRKLTGSVTATGLITMLTNPDFTKGKAGDTKIYVGNLKHKSVRITITGVAVLDIEANNDDPDVAGDWFGIGSYGASAYVDLPDHYTFLRFNVSSFTSGSVGIEFSGSA